MAYDRTITSESVNNNTNYWIKGESYSIHQGDSTLRGEVGTYGGGGGEK